MHVCVQIHGVPVLSRDDMQMPVVICVALERTDWADSVEDGLQQICSASGEGAPQDGVNYYHMV